MDVNTPLSPREDLAVFSSLEVTVVDWLRTYYQCVRQLVDLFQDLTCS